MKRALATAPARSKALAAMICLALAAAQAPAASTDLADSPLANTPTVTILPNIFFILDDSGSMSRDYMPDYVYEGGYCRDSSDGGSGLDACRRGDPPYMVPGFNGVAYNPAVTYSPPVKADGTVKAAHNGWLASSHNWNQVPIDGYGRLDTGTTNLSNNFPERKWCDGAGGTGTCKSALDASNNYIYPNGTYQYLKTDYGNPYYYTATVEWCKNRNTSGTDVNFGSTSCQTKKTSTYQYVKYSNWQRVDIKSSTASYTKAATRTDCAGATCTYNEEMANFANWYAWYSTRMQMMKTAMSLAFKDIRGTPNEADPTDKNYFHARVGYTVISYSGTTDGNDYLAISEFDGSSSTTQKGKFYDRLFVADASGWTPLRGALAKAGKIYAGVKGTDPIQFSCQRNFTILSTDGYWNSNAESSSYGPDKINDADVGDMDGSTASGSCNTSEVLPTCTTAGTCTATALRPECDTKRKSPTLADVAYYYYHTDLRPGTCAKCTDNVPPAGTKVAEDDVATHQHMTTFTIGLGVDGTLAYQDGYKTSTSGDYYNIKQGTAEWPDPMAAENETRIDDLWHAAVNGRGTYFSGRDPTKLIDGLRTALGAMESTSGAGAAAATSNLEPVEGDNYIYIANYRTVYWDGELSAHTISLTTGAIDTAPVWQASVKLDTKIAVSGDADTRTIYTSGSSGSLYPFTWTNLPAAQRSHFDNTKLSQYPDWSDADKAATTGERMVNFLRGHHRYEDQDRDAGFGTYSRLYRDRAKALGDIGHGQPVYVQKSFYDFGGDYDAFKTSVASRSSTVYVAANDGMLHAFDASNGNERWAYVIPIVMKNLWRLADKDYATNHRFFADGPIAVNDAKINGSWKTILVGALGKGGRGYYALDITSPTSPSLLWTFSADDNPNVGYSYGTPIITSVNGTWVVLVTSGYNNTPEADGSYPTADGKGYLFMLDAATGSPLKTIGTGNGNATDPSGLASINIKVASFKTSNTATTAYGGDLRGDLWRFDLAAGTASKLIALGSTQPITAAPEVGDVEGKTAIMFGTGRYLGQTDLANTAPQAVYAIRDDGATTVSKGSLVVQTGSAEVNWNTDWGWYYNLTVSGERVNIEGQLFLGTLIIATTIPTATECQPGGYGRLYYFDYTSGLAIEGYSLYAEYTSPIVGFTVARPADEGTPRVYPITADGKLITSVGNLPFKPPPSQTSGTRLIWRELID